MIRWEIISFENFCPSNNYFIIKVLSVVRDFVRTTWPLRGSCQTGKRKARTVDRNPGRPGRRSDIVYQILDSNIYDLRYALYDLRFQKESVLLKLKIVNQNYRQSFVDVWR